MSDAMVSQGMFEQMEDFSAGLQGFVENYACNPSKKIRISSPEAHEFGLISNAELTSVSKKCQSFLKKRGLWDQNSRIQFGKGVFKSKQTLKKSAKKNQKGQTVIEFAIILAIVGILAIAITTLIGSAFSTPSKAKNNPTHQITKIDEPTTTASQTEFVIEVGPEILPSKRYTDPEIFVVKHKVSGKRFMLVYVGQGVAITPLPD